MLVIENSWSQLTTEPGGCVVEIGKGLRPAGLKATGRW